MIRVILVDRQELFRQSFKSLIESDQDNQVVFSSNSFYETRMKLCTDCGDVLITDVSGIGKEGWLDLEEIMHQHPTLKLMVVSDDINSEVMSRLMEIRVQAIYSKLAEPSIILEALKALTSWDRQYDLKIGVHIRNKLTAIIHDEQEQNRIRVIHFTDRELQVLDFVKKEWTSTQIAEELNLSIRTVDSHRKRMIAKTGSKTIIGVLVYVYERGILRR